MRKGKIFLWSALIVWVMAMAMISFVEKVNNVPHDVVLPAISKAHAQGMVKENECYIVRVANPEEFGTGGWYYMEGRKKRKMMLGGRNPAHELSYIFRESDQNSFLVQGKINGYLTQYNGCPTLIVEKWYIIAPIKRDYGYREYRKEQRFFYPKDYLDVYDVEQGDYTPLESQ